MRKIVIQKMIGGLGNQMFQYAFIKALSLRNNVDFKIDLSPFEYYKTWPYELDIFNIEKNYAKKNEIPFYERLHYKYKYLNYINNITIKSFCVKINKNHKIENNLKFNDWLLDEKEGYFDGYFQCDKYFKDFESEIRKDFKFQKPLLRKNVELLRSIKGKNLVSVHIRRGDYLKHPSVYTICSVEYYIKAIKYMCNNVNNPLFLFFSDDPTRVKENFKGDNYIYVDWNKGENNWQDMFLMSSCNHNIIANSSFSWRGGWLNGNSNKIIIAPNNRGMMNQDIVPTGRIVM